MNKLLLLLLMPFFIGCGNHGAGSDEIAATLKRLLAEKKIDSLEIIGKQYKWTGGFEETGFKDYVLLNKQVADSIEGFKRSVANIFLDNIIQYEDALSRDSSMIGILLNSLYENAENIIISSREGYYDKVVVNYEKCLFYQEKSPLLDSSDYFLACRDLGIQYNTLGEKEKADNYYRKALNYYDRNASLSARRINKIASAAINSLIFFNEYKLYDSAISNARQTLLLENISAQKTAQIRAAYAEALYAQGNPLYKQQLEIAWNLLEKIPQSESNGDILGKRRDVLKLKGQIALKEKYYESARSFFHQALDTCLKRNNSNTHERFYAKLLLEIANVHDSIGQYDSALYFCQYALSSVTKTDSADILSNPVVKDLYTENTIMEALDAKARLLQKKYQQRQDAVLLANAVTCYELAFEVERKLTDNFTYDSSRAVMQQQSKMRSSAAIKNCYILYSITKDKKWAEKAFRFSESSKALLMLEAVKQNIFYNKALKDDPRLKKLDSLKLQYAYVETRLLQTKSSEGDSALLTRKKELEAAVDAAVSALEQENLSYKKLAQAADTNLLPELRKKLLNDNRSLAEFFCSGTDNYLFVINRADEIGFYQLDSTVIASVDSLLHFFDNAGSISNDPPGYKQVAYNIYKSIYLQQVPAAITSMLIVPDGAFSQLPFDALLTQSDVTTGFKNAPYLLQRFTTSYGYSAASLLQQYDNYNSTNKTLAVFAPVFEQQQRQLSPLLNTRNEAKGIGADKGSVFTDDKATVASFRHSLTHAGMLHLATHAGLDSQAGIPRLELYDSSFLINELYARRINTSLVMLNACQTNKGKIHESEGALSLARGFYYAGAKNVVASLWNVDDISGAKIAENFYRQAQKNDYNFGAALHKAKKDFLVDNPGGTRCSPYYWAALIHIGGPVKSNGVSGLVKYGAVTGCLLLLLMFVVARKRKQVYEVTVNQPAVDRLNRAK
jgi:CHAT domain-containing protein/tetratricopeptide (TPR) repeat protein